MFEIIAIHMGYGQVLNSKGTRMINGRDEFSPKFNSLEEALKEKDNILEKWVHAGIYINDLENETTSELYSNIEKYHLYEKEEKKYIKWQYSFWRKYFFKEPPINYYIPEDLKEIREQANRAEFEKP